MAVPVTVFSDFACPFSYVTEAMLRRMEAAGEIESTYLAYELFPAPAPLRGGGGEWMEALTPLADELGLEIGVPPAPVRTAKAHEAAAFAQSRGTGPAMRDAIYRAYFVDGRDISRIDVLVALGTALGMDAGEMKVVLDVDTWAPRIAAEQDAARRAGVDGTPTVVVGTGDAAQWLVGARPYAELRAALLGNE
ncbi:DsbA family oxidoreductase [Longimicrobium sp.]|uniref:DsbA family oxidoreductase n=1 Tax=Longimicrobium sp. TaxID=2029185 RepID=UPI002E2F355D|nr:DsbA family protein [Longimicrobium sp.]HEX6040929.1 DsbA family protein [Longimicrobium sp.]